MPYNSAFSPSTFAREGKKRSTYLTEFEKDLVSICNEQTKAGGKRFKWHFFFIQDFDVSNPSSETSIDYLILSKFNSAWKKKLAVLLKEAPAASGVCKGKCWVSSLEEKPGDDKFYISIAGGISQVIIDGRDNPSTSTANKAIITKSLKKDWLKRLKIKAGEAELTEREEFGVEDPTDNGAPQSRPDEARTNAANEKKVADVKQKIKEFKAVDVKDEVKQIKRLVDLQKATNTLLENNEFKATVQASIDKNFQEIEEEVFHETQQDYDDFQEQEMANVFVDDYDLAKEGIKELRTFHDKWKEVVSLMEKAGVKVGTKADLNKIDALIKDEEKQYAKAPTKSDETGERANLKKSADDILADLKTFMKSEKDKLKERGLQEKLEKLKKDFNEWYQKVSDAKHENNFKKYHKFVEKRIGEEEKYMEALATFKQKRSNIATTADLRKELIKSGISHYNSIWADYDSELKTLEEFDKSVDDFVQKNPSGEILSNADDLKTTVTADIDNPDNKYYTDISSRADNDSKRIANIMAEIPKLLTASNNLPDTRPTDLVTKIENITTLQTQLSEVAETLDKIKEKAALGQEAVEIFAKGEKTTEGSSEEKKLWEEFSGAIRKFEAVGV